MKTELNLMPAPVPPLQRFEVNAITGCWIWLGYTEKNGYGRLNGENAHRVFWREAKGAIAEGHDIDHLCKRRNCVNPDHCEAVTEEENLRRKSREVIYLGRTVGICRRGHILEGDNVRMYRGKRQCRPCERLRRAQSKDAA